MSKPDESSGGGKLPGKTVYSGRRRTVARRSGFSVHPGTTGGEYERAAVTRTALSAGDTLEIGFTIPAGEVGRFAGFGGWFTSAGPLAVAVAGSPAPYTLTDYPNPSWNKIGSLWKVSHDQPTTVTAQFTATGPAEVAIYEMMCGIVEHVYLANARPALLKNMFETVPEALFIATAGDVVINWPQKDGGDEPANAVLYLKSCNRCARFLPFNRPRERDQLSYSNHCVADHRRPCRHNSFGRLRSTQGGPILQLEYGFQLECRFCKKFAVNAALNPQRTKAQMKEDAARRRAIELLLTELYGKSPQLRYRHDHGTELVDDVLARFDHRCFKCGKSLGKDWHLDHTRPLALMWPLDGTATALCKTHNSEKRDRPPSEYYTPEKLAELATITGIPLAELQDPTPNMYAVGLLTGRLDWFFDTFLRRREMLEERDGKITGELLVKALQKTLARCSGGPPVDLVAMYESRRAK